MVHGAWYVMTFGIKKMLWCSVASLVMKQGIPAPRIQITSARVLSLYLIECNAKEMKTNSGCALMVYGVSPPAYVQKQHRSTVVRFHFYAFIALIPSSDTLSP